jgi:hypothetical protein
MLRRRAGTLLVVVLLLSTMAMLGAAPAHAGIKETPFPSDRRAGVTANFIINGSPGPVWAVLRYDSVYPYTTLLSLYVLQCDGLGHNCGRIAANATQQLGATHISTSEKPYSFGHVYKACGSVKDTDGWRLLDVCGAPTT